jgi:hypothetical protein
VYDRVRERTPNQTPSIKSDLEGVLYLARSAYRAPVVPAKLDPELIARTEDRYAGIREGAVQEIGSLLSSSDPSVALAAREVLLLMTSDDSRRVAARAQTALEAADDATEAPPSGPREDAAEAPPSEPPVQPEPSAAAPPRGAPAPRSRRPIAIGVALAVLAACAIVAIVALSGGGSSGGSHELSTTTAVNASDKIPASNLTKNPSFEQSTANWDTYQSERLREQAKDAPDGHQVVRIVAAKPNAEFGIDDDPDTVQHSVEGRAYTGEASVKATDATQGQTVCLGIRERDAAGDLKGQAYGGVNLSTARYQQIRVSYVAHGTGNRVDVHLFSPAAGGSAGDAFLADAISLAPGDRGTTGGSLC